ncbi:TPA: hypothetical protein DDW35_12330 [Candidatus Sumerlaeota bacterium]|jgi:excisionase family DNA binding protein|nr:hypothetical protein [Candidatus Sumerlaeota bacterium]
MENTLQLCRVWRVAKELDVSKKRVYQMVQEGKVEAIRLGPRSMRITRESIDAFVANGRKSNREELGLNYRRPNARKLTPTMAAIAASGA